MIPFNAASVGAYWERLRVLPLEQRQVAGREPPSEQRLEGQPGYSEELRVHLRRHRAPITATQPMDLLLTGIRATVIQATHSRAMEIRVTRDTPLIPVVRAMDTRIIRVSELTPVLRAIDTQATQATQDSPPTLVPRVTDRQATRGTPTPDPRPMRRQATRDSPLTPVLRAMDFRARRLILPTPGPVTEIPSLAIPASALRRTGRLGPSTRSSQLAEFRPDTKSFPHRCAGQWSGR
jgi:hypothetical protein